MDRERARERLLARLDAIAASLERSKKGLALIGLGSVGRETGRIDAFSDLDFFAIVEPATKSDFLDDLSWLESVAPIAFRFKNTADGYKALFEDGILCEFAVFEPAELDAIPFAPGRVVWKRAGVDDAIAIPRLPEPAPEPRTMEWLVGEALTNLTSASAASAAARSSPAAASSSSTPSTASSSSRRSSRARRATRATLSRTSAASSDDSPRRHGSFSVSSRDTGAPPNRPSRSSRGSKRAST